jgi:hypothetical protein
MALSLSIAKAAIPRAQTDAEALAYRLGSVPLVVVDKHFDGQGAGVRVHVFLLVMGCFRTSGDSVLVLRRFRICGPGVVLKDFWVARLEEFQLSFRDAIGSPVRNRWRLDLAKASNGGGSAKAVNDDVGVVDVHDRILGMPKTIWQAFLGFP